MWQHLPFSIPRHMLPAALGAALIAGAPGAYHAARIASARRADLLRHVSAARIQADLDGDRIFDDLEARLASIPAQTALPVIVRYKAGRAASGARVMRWAARTLAADG